MINYTKLLCEKYLLLVESIRLNGPNKSLDQERKNLKKLLKLDLTYDGISNDLFHLIAEYYELEDKEKILEVLLERGVIDEIIYSPQLASNSHNFLTKHIKRGTRILIHKRAEAIIVVYNPQYYSKGSNR